MESFDTLKNRFVSSVSSAIDKTEKNMVHLGTSDGSGGQTYYLKDRFVVLESITVYVGDETWEETADITVVGPDEKVYQIVYASLKYGITTARPMIIFGDDTSGEKPDEDAQILCDYESARYSMSDYELCVLFHNCIAHVNRDFGIAVEVTSVDYDTASLDIEYDDDEFLDLILYRARYEYEIRRINSDDAIYVKSQSLVVDGKQMAKSQKDSCDLMKAWYKEISNTYIKTNQVPRFTSMATIFGDTTFEETE
jgi:hypothetical protein